jgi:hypothetical protein
MYHTRETISFLRIEYDTIIVKYHKLMISSYNLDVMVLYMGMLMLQFISGRLISF